MLRKIEAILRKVGAATALGHDLIRLYIRNRFTTASVVDPNSHHAAVVSLTSYGSRIATVSFAIESIGRGDVKPTRLILWLDDEAAVLRPNRALQRLQRRGLEIQLTSDLGPHKKYYPYLESQSSFDSPLITADDDTLYPRDWLAVLLKSFEQFPSCVSCFRASKIVLKNGELEPYLSWPDSQSDQPSVLTFAKGGSGILYPPTLLPHIKRAGLTFMELAPRADDVWLHAQAILSGYNVRQVYNQSRLFPTLPNTHSSALSRINNGTGGNDVQISATYGDEHMKLFTLEDARN